MSFLHSLSPRVLGSQLCPALSVSPWWDLPPPGWELLLPPRLDWTLLFRRYNCTGPSRVDATVPLPLSPTGPRCSLLGCIPGMFGANCSQPCQCGLGQKCHPETGACACPPGHSGAPCRIGELSSNPCFPQEVGTQAPTHFHGSLVPGATLPSCWGLFANSGFVSRAAMPC